uniref:Sushi domain-containing protein n=1 Tax=Oryzias latipes TaxID=8090 RepID=A0A3B3HMA9_ORYLA
MWILSFLLLTWFPAVLHAAGSCARPELTHGFLVPDRQSYPENSVTYACDDGFKSAMESWWGTTTCQNGKWFPEPFCIGSGWFEENDKLTVDCDPGYRLTKAFPQPTCIKGSWTSIPTCEKKKGACDRPPKISNATILHEASQEVFAEGSKLQYECKTGHNTEDGKTQESITCRAGWWMTPLPCPACVMRQGQYTDFKLTKDELLMEGEIRSFNCGYPGYEKRARCINSEIFLTHCKCKT